MLNAIFTCTYLYFYRIIYRYGVLLCLLHFIHTKYLHVNGPNKMKHLMYIISNYESITYLLYDMKSKLNCWFYINYLRIKYTRMNKNVTQKF